MHSTDSKAYAPKKGDKGVAATTTGALKAAAYAAPEARCFQTGFTDSTGPPLPDDSDLIASPEMRRMLGGVSAMTIYRWTHSETIQFPVPDAIIAGRSFWRKGTIRRFIERHAYQAGRRRRPRKARP